MFFFFTDPSTSWLYTLSLHDALPILVVEHVHAEAVDDGLRLRIAHGDGGDVEGRRLVGLAHVAGPLGMEEEAALKDRKSTRLNSSHGYISYAVFCLKKKTKSSKSLQK